MPVRRERPFIIAATSGNSAERPAIRTSKRPQVLRELASARSSRRSASGGSRVSACRNSSTSASAAAGSRAPAFICSARPRAAATTRSASGTAQATLSSWLPPSTTITRVPRSRSGCSTASAAGSAALSFRTGMMMASRITAHLATAPARATAVA